MKTYLVYISLFVFLFSCTQEISFHGKKISLSYIKRVKAKNLSKKVCSSCHLYPDPKYLDKDTTAFVVATMGLYLGISDPTFLLFHPVYASAYSKRKTLLEFAGLMPKTPTISHEEWELIRNYYLLEAPTKIKIEPKDFFPYPYYEIDNSFLHKIQDPAISFLRVIQKTIFVGTAWKPALWKFNLSGQFLSRTDIPSPLVDIDSKTHFQYWTLLGDLLGNKVGEKPAAIWQVVGNQSRPFVQHLERAAQSLLDDPLLFTALFGALKGGGLLVTNIQTKQQKIYLKGESVIGVALIDKKKSTRTLAVLTADARESLRICTFRGDQLVSQKMIVKKPPFWGYTMIRSADFNGDGKKDILVVNGDNLDAGPINPLKKIHGLEIFLNKGNTFESGYRFSFFGAYTVDLAYINQDDILDIGLTSAFRDPRVPDNPGFVLLLSQNSEKINYKPYYIPSLPKARYTLVHFYQPNKNKKPWIFLATPGFPLLYKKENNDSFQLKKENPLPQRIFILKPKNALTAPK
ncbi:MAG: VCBS repeat-containing protein [Candidatus Hydrogenedentota bacterium]|nr:MAG: VCBS repeat-containing protein [Candidatus Hydrogenedentota bacterium]